MNTTTQFPAQFGATALPTQQQAPPKPKKTRRGIKPDLAARLKGCKKGCC